MSTGFVYVAAVVPVRDVQRTIGRVADKFGKHHDSVERCTQFMAQARQEVRLGFACLRELRLDLSSCSDVANAVGHQNATLGSQGAEADFDRELRAVLAYAMKIDHPAHRRYPWVDHERGKLCQIFLPVLFRHQHLYRLVQKLFTSITEQVFGLGIDQGDTVFFVNDDHRVGRRFQETTEFLLADTQGLVRAPDIGGGGSHYTDNGHHGDGADAEESSLVNRQMRIFRRDDEEPRREHG